MERKKQKIIIGLTGPMAAGHGVIADYLKKKGFYCSSTSDRIREECRRQGLEITRKNLQRLGDELRCQFGPEILAKRTLQKVQKYPLSVIDSIRSIAEVEFLKKRPNFYLLGITAPQKVRYQRLVVRNRESDPITWKAFLVADKKDFKSGQGKSGRNITACLKQADLLLHNNQKIKDLEKKVGQWLSKKF
jgi:dephospho-CoA kinase